MRFEDVAIGWIFGLVCGGWLFAGFQFLGDRLRARRAPQPPAGRTIGRGLR